MPRKRKEFTVDLKVEYVPVSPEREGQYRAGLLLLLKLLYEARDCQA